MKTSAKGPEDTLGWAVPPRAADASGAVTSLPQTRKLVPKWGRGERGGADLPPFTPMDGSSFAPAIASTIPIMNHSFLIRSSSLMFVRVGAFCLFVCLFSFLSCDRLIPGVSPHFPRSLLTCSRASQIATCKLKTRGLLRRLRGGLGVVVSSDRKASLSAAITTTRLLIDAHRPDPLWPRPPSANAPPRTVGPGWPAQEVGDRRLAPGWGSQTRHFQDLRNLRGLGQGET